MTLPHESHGMRFITDGGLETTLVFVDGIDLADFAAFPLLDHDDGRAALRRYYTPYLELARERGAPFVLDTPTWRANPDWGAGLGYAAERLAEVNREAVRFVAALAREFADVETVINGVIGPRGDGYVVGATMTPDEAADYHALQATAFAGAGADMLTGVTMTYSDEAIGVTRAASAAGLPAVVSFTVETDGRLPSQQLLADAIAVVDDATNAGPAYYMINCAHPTHFMSALEAGADWTRRIKAVRANASRLSHAELDEATELDRGDIGELADLYHELGSVLDLRVVGGCCGTDHEHIAAITAAR